MRIIAGKFRGKIISPSSSFKARPTTDFAKESLFNILNNYYNFDNIKVLDLFSGTGAISYEFCSRGAISVLAVESNFNHFAFIKSQFDQLGFEQANVLRMDALKFVNNCREKFDIIFADPPYYLENIESIYDAVVKNELFDSSSMLIIEHSHKTDFSKHKYFSMLKKYGSVCFSFFEFDK